MKNLLTVAALTLGLALPVAAHANPSAGQLNFQYNEPIPATGDLSAPRAAILADAEKDCAAAQKAFGLVCQIGDIQFNAQGYGRFGQQAPPNSMSGQVNMQLMPLKQSN